MTIKEGMCKLWKCYAEFLQPIARFQNTADLDSLFPYYSGGSPEEKDANALRHDWNVAGENLWSVFFPQYHI